MRPERGENSKPDSMEARLRRLPPPPVPTDLEARLLADIPAGGPIRRWRWNRWVVGLSALAAACLVIVLAWPKNGGQKTVPLPKGNPVAVDGPTPSINPQKSQDTPSAWLQARRNSDDPKLAPFTWPVDEARPLMASSSIPSDLLN
jgi:hypothetical protein